jgi:hypothetical protein
MKVLIQESKLKSFIDNQLDYNLSDRIEVVDSWEGAPPKVRYMFGGKNQFNYLLNNYGPMFFFISPNFESENYLVQHRKNDEGEWYWDIKDYWNKPIDEATVMDSLGLNFGIPVGKLIKHYVED